MKIRKILIVLLLLMCVAPVSAQRPKIKIEWGIMGGVNVSDFSTNMEETEVKDKLGWQLGMMTAINFGIVALEPQIIYVRQGLRIRQKGLSEINLTSSSIDVPVLFSLRVLRPLRLNVGPVFTVMNSCREKSGKDRLDFGRVRSSVSFTVGASVVLIKHLLIDLRYNGQFTSKKDVVVADGRMLDLRSFNLALSVGYLF